MKNRENIKRYFKPATVSDFIIIALLGLLSIYFIGTFTYFVIIGRVRDCLMCVAYFLVIPIFFLIEKTLRVKIPVLTALVLVLFMLGNSLGASFNMYTVIPCLDDILHAVWGVVFTVLGITIIKGVLGEPENKKSFAMYMVLGFAFACMTAVLWELFEFSTDQLMSTVDQQEDTIVSSIHSFLLYPGYDHYHTEVIEGIAYTQLYDINGNLLYTIEGGYLDTGILDTMWDMIFCTVSSFVVCAALTVEKCAAKKQYLYKLLIPNPVSVKQSVPEKVQVPDEDTCPVLK